MVPLLLPLTQSDNNLLLQVHHMASCHRNRRASSLNDGPAQHHGDTVGDARAPLVTNNDKITTHFNRLRYWLWRDGAKGPTLLPSGVWWQLKKGWDEATGLGHVPLTALPPLAGWQGEHPARPATYPQWFSSGTTAEMIWADRLIQGNLENGQYNEGDYGN